MDDGRAAVSVDGRQALLPLLLLLLLPSTSDGVVDELYNPLHKYCGISMEEAHRFCHLPANMSLPCPNGDLDCPYDLPCWALDSPCTMPPSTAPSATPTLEVTETPTPPVSTMAPSIAPTTSVAPTLRPTTMSPITKISSNPGDHHFCGLGFDNLFDCAVNCPNGSPGECPAGQLCYFNTPCDARLMVPEETVDDDEEGEGEEAVDEEEAAAADDGDIANQKFCGSDVSDAGENCSRDRHCPVGDECAPDQYCFVVNCFADEFPTNEPTGSPRPSGVATLPLPPSSPSPIAAPLEADDIRNFFWCGVDWGDASARCYLPCIGGFHSECPEGEECFANVSCKGVAEEGEEGGGDDDEDGGVEESHGRTPSPDGSTWSPTATSPPAGDGDAEQSVERTPSPDGSTWSPTTTALDETLLPTASPITADDMRNFFFCGKNWTDASTRCYKQCMSSFHSECDEDEECFAQADCDGVLTLEPTTLAPIGAPTISPIPTVNPASTSTPTEPPPTLPPVFAPSEGPTTPFPSDAASIGPTIPISSIPTAVGLQFDTDAPTFGNVDDQEFAPDDPAGFFFCGTDWNHAITECPHRCPSGEGSQCPDGMFCYAFTPCVGIGGGGMGDVKPTWEPTLHPISSSPSTTEQYWAAQHDEMNGESAWTESPTTKLSFGPTGDPCRGQPCDYKGECRSALGFCGEGVVYCNSKSTWEPTCGGGGQLTLLEEDEVTSKNNTEPTASPVTLWEAWVADRDENSPVGSDEEYDGWYEGEGNETGNATSNVIIPGAEWDNWAISEWSSRSSSTKWGYIFPYTTVLFVIFSIALL